MKRFAYILFSLALGWLLYSCTSAGCTENLSATPLAGFYANQTDTKISIDSLQIWGIDAPLHSYLVDFDKRVSSSYLPFRPEYESTGFVFRYGQGMLDQEKYQDTLIFWYTATPRFVSATCGAMFFYNIDRMYYSRHLVDSIAITDSLITNLDVERIKVYFRTEKEESGNQNQNSDQPSSGNNQNQTSLASWDNYDNYKTFNIE